MWWRLRRSQFIKQKGAANKRALKSIVNDGKIPGIVAYFEETPIGWCAVAPRETFSALDRSRVLKRVDEKPVWSVVCFFVAKPSRHKGVTVQLLKAAVDYVRSQGGKVVEGYPIDARKRSMPDPFVYTGLTSAFEETGFEEVLRRSETRPIMRYFIKEKKTRSV